MAPETYTTDRQHWDNAWAREPRMRLPSGLFVGTRNVQRLLRKYILPGTKVLEIGCAPGKMLAWVAKTLKAEVAGLDYSKVGINHTRKLFGVIGILGDIRCEDIFSTSFETERFDFVFSCGVIEHFDDPTDILIIHARLLKAGGTAVVLIPNYGGIYGRLQNYFDANNLSLHNMNIMSPALLSGVAPTQCIYSSRSFEFGHLTSTLVNLDKKLPKVIAWGLTMIFNILGLLQPFDIKALCPFIVLEMKKNKKESA
jgi:2-polyprenyl-3-methyl-5-hydroxy-6-metoxy-1,4-benzoquinol methylase